MARTIGEAFVKVSPLTNAFGGALRAGLAAVGIGGAVAGLTALGTQGIKTAADLQQAQVAFTTLIGNSQKAQRFIGDLKKFAASTPFELPGLVDNARLLLGVGVQAKNVIPTLTAWGDAAGALGLSQDRFNSALLAVTQSMGAGKINAQDMNQIVNAGIPIWRLMAEATGKSVPELRKLSSEGKLLSSDILPKLQKQMEKDYGGSMQKQSQTLAGVWSTLMDTINLGMADALQPLVPILQGAIPRAATVLTRAFRAGSAIMQAFFRGLEGGRGKTDSFADKVTNFGNIIRQTFIWVQQNVIPILATVGGWLSTVATFLTSGGRAASILRVALLGAVIAITAIRVATALWTVAQTALDIAMDANPIGAIIVGVAALIAVIVYLATQTRFFQVIWNAVWGFLKAVGAWFAGPFAGFFVTGYNKFMGAVMAVWNWIRGHWPLLLSIITGPIGAAVIFIVTHWGQIKNFIVNTFNDVVSFFKSVPGRILGALGDVARLLFDAGRKIVQGLINGIKSMISAAGDAIGSVVDHIKGFLPFSPAKRGPLAGRGSPFYSGQSIGRMLADGMTSQTGTVSAAMTSLVNLNTAPSSRAGAAAGDRPLTAREFESILARARLQIDDRTGRFAGLLTRGG